MRALPWIVLVLTGCGRNEAPMIGRIDDVRAAVDVELAIAIAVTDRDADELELTFDADLQNIGTRARLVGPKQGVATFLWTPLLSDIGEHEFTFAASDGKERAVRKATIAVAASEGQGAPVFVQPLGTGTTMDLGGGPCLDVPIVVTDPDTPGVSLGLAEPRLANSEIVQDSELTGTWTFCPSRDQVKSGDRFTARLTADDFEHPAVVKDYLIVLLGEAGDSCPGAAPAVTHTPRDWNTIGNLEVSARVTDPEGLKFEPLLYYTFDRPSSPPDISSMVQVTMDLQSGDMRDGQWVGRIPNPVAGSPGASEDVWYVIAATDNDDLEGACDHTTLAPAGSAWDATVTASGSTGGGLGICEPCTADAQCGGPDDLCVAFAGDVTCFRECSSNSDCPSDTYCSSSTFTSVNGRQGRQCIPLALTCDPPAPACVDDRYEDNDDLLYADPIGLGAYSLVSCPSDEDWFEISLSREGDLDVLLDGGSGSDLDLAIYDGWGGLLDSSTSTSSLEAATACVPAGDYLVRVYPYGSGENVYDLDIDHTPRSCSGVCTDDFAEPDDDFYDARPADLDFGTYEVWNQQICAFDEDWFEVYLFAGEELWVTLDFLQTAADEDLDLMVVDYYGYIMVGCLENEDSDWCDPYNGQSGDSNEELYLPVYWEDWYYVIVRGWNGSENEYDLCIGLDWLDCP